jgi:hypothetical protein
VIQFSARNAMLSLIQTVRSRRRSWSLNRTMRSCKMTRGKSGAVNSVTLLTR